MMERGQYKQFSHLLLDGQQRLRTIERYVNDEVAVPDAEGILRLWSELSLTQRRRFARTTFPKSVVHVWDEQQLCDIYNRRNFTGTAHLDTERAVPMG
jgi:hypothetical protein